MRTYLLDLISFLLICGTGLSLWRHDAWWVRAWDFPRAQILAVGVLIITSYILLGQPDAPPRYTLFFLLCLAMLIQTWQILPYTPLHKKESLKSITQQPGQGFSLLLANVYMENRDADRLIGLIRQKQPTIVFVAETDSWWIEHLAVLRQTYPHFIEKPLDNTYGMAVYSRLPWIEPTVRYLTEPDIPSFHGDIRFDSGQLVRVHLLHPKPPYPAESSTTEERDAEILMVGREVAQHPAPTVVGGDLNDVAWSHTTRLFRRISGLLDPRIGRGLYSTFHAKLPFLRWPLDHVFHSAHFKLLRLRQLPDIGSDHFPIFIELSLEPSNPVPVQEPPAPKTGDFEEAHEKIDQVPPPNNSK